jgi:glycosyltransferase involved in cell wall biosynthesis
MRLVFILPGPGNLPVGGYKVVYEYANGLARRGHKVFVMHTALLDSDIKFAVRLRKIARFVSRSLDKSYRPDRWFSLDPGVEVLWVPSLRERNIPDADRVVATAWQTAEWVNGYSERKGKKHYLIQHLENWSGPEERVLATWKMPLCKIVISRWLQELASTLGEESFYIPNGLNFSQFSLDLPVEERNPKRVMMLYHDYVWKGTADGLAALERVHEVEPELEVTLFGVPEYAGKNTPWITYHRTPPQSELRRLYNEAAIFVTPSLAEGWPLPPAEALMCGAALVATDIGGHREYAIHNETALLGPPEDPVSLANNIIRLIRDQDLRIRLAKEGHAFIQQFTWERAVDKFESFLKNKLH